MNNIVYLIGAGASKDFGMPLGNEIFEQAYRLPKLMKLGGQRDEMVALLRNIDDHLRHIFTRLPDEKNKYPPFEEVLTFLWEYRKSEKMNYDTRQLVSVFSNKGGARDVFDDFTRLLGLTLAESIRLADADTYARSLKNFVKSLFNKGDNVAFICMNYDTPIDNALGECVTAGVIDDFRYSIPLYDIASKRDRYNPPKHMCRESGILLLKPHGSLNLVYCPHHQARYGHGFYYGGRDSIAATCGTLNCPGCGRHPKPLIIPPLYNKAEYVAANAAKTPHKINFRASPETYRLYVDHQIREVLAVATEIVLIGYSMPAYDYDFRTLFVSSLMGNENRQSLKLKLITKGNSSDLVSQFERFVGAVEVLAEDGFLDYLTRTGFE